MEKRMPTTVMKRAVIDQMTFQRDASFRPRKGLTEAEKLWQPVASLILHINRALIHQAAEWCLLHDPCRQWVTLTG